LLLDFSNYIFSLNPDFSKADCKLHIVVDKGCKVHFDSGMAVDNAKAEKHAELDSA
jgi:hypothetical protein